MIESRRAARPDRPVEVLAAAVGAAMDERGAHRREPVGVGARRRRRDSTDPAHRGELYGRGRAEAAPQRLPEHAPPGGEHGAEVEAHGTVGDPLEVVRELLRHRRLVAAPHLCEPGEPGPDDQPLPVGRQVVRELLEEHRADRARADEAHVAAQHVMNCGISSSCVAFSHLPIVVNSSCVRRRAPRRGTARAATRRPAERPELQHREHAAAATDALAAVEDRPPARREHDQRDRHRDGQRDRRGRTPRARRRACGGAGRAAGPASRAPAAGSRG